ncbi:hypothetical protein GE061_018878 [Apolygus lucorum]|uniref:Cyclic nucleotide-binding domain-containing protein n=1 Tax=Apolygus lucorum TaxID=248454 RepID=A0A8S9X6V6_APOLU|nr:hypothetical protein GE061_018878 [Apolygus lucorum]
MALIDTGSDVWLVEYESCERLHSDIVKQLSDRDAQHRGSDKFNGISASVRIHLSQFNIELSQLEDRLKATPNITAEERERRQRLIEDLQSKFIHLTKLYQTNPEKFERRKLFGEPSWQEDDESDVPLLGAEASVQDIKDLQRKILADQDRGLENLSTIIGRQKNIANTISIEVDTHNEIIDDISARMDATTAGIRGTTTTVTVVSRSDSTLWYWVTIILLFLCILGLVLGKFQNSQKVSNGRTWIMELFQLDLTFGVFSWFAEKWFFLFNNESIDEDYYQMKDLIVLFILIVTAVTIITVLVLRKWKHKVLPEVKKLVGVGPKGPRFRKRDKVLFYGRKMLRKVKSLSGQVKQGKKRKLVLKLANRILRLKKDAERVPELKTLEPPAEYLQEDLKDDQNIPPDAFYMLQSIRVFGHFEKPIFLKLCKHTEIMTLSAGEFLFKIGEPDENVYVVQNGKVNVYINNSDGSIISLKVVKPGDSVTSLLSFTDVLTGHPHPYRTVSARAIEDSTVVRLPMAAFQEVFQEYPDSFIRVMQVIMVRLQRVTFTALHQYLGLTAELVKPSKDKDRKKPSHGSPTKLRESIILKDDISSNFVSPTDEDADLAGQPTTRKSRSAFELKPPPEFNEEGARVPRGTASRKSLENMTEEELIKVATEAFVRELGLEDDSIFAGDRDKLEIKQVPAGTYLMKEESNKDVALVYLLSGTLSVSQRTPDVNDEVHMFTAYPGEIVGGLAVLTGEPSFYSIRAKHQATIALLSKSTVYNILREQPRVVLHIAHTVVRRLSPFVRQVDFALDWVFLESGRAVYRQGDDSDCTYIVLSGRLRSVITHSSGKKELVGEYGKGDLVGIVSTQILS